MSLGTLTTHSVQVSVTNRKRPVFVMRNLPRNLPTPEMISTNPGSQRQSNQKTLQATTWEALLLASYGWESIYKSQNERPAIRRSRNPGTARDLTQPPRRPSISTVTHSRSLSSSTVPSHTRIHRRRSRCLDRCRYPGTGERRAT
jgi:hypothetical protein